MWAVSVDIYSAGDGNRVNWTVSVIIYFYWAGGSGMWAVSVYIYSAGDEDRGK